MFPTHPSSIRGQADLPMGYINLEYPKTYLPYLDKIYNVLCFCEKKIKSNLWHNMQFEWSQPW